MIKKAGYLKGTEARLNGFFKGNEKVKGATLTQAECDEWNGVKKAAPKKVEEVVEEVAAVEEEVKPTKSSTSKKSK